MKRLWLVRLGRYGEQEAHALTQSELVLGFNVGDLSGAKDRDSILQIAAKTYPDKKPKTQLNFAAQLNQFCNVMQPGDLAVVPLKTAPQIAIGQISGPYKNSSGKPSRPVKWLKTDLARSVFKQDLLYSFGAFMTVCEISRNNALSRIEAVLKAGYDPGYAGDLNVSGTVTKTSDSTGEESAASEEVDLAEIGRDQIERYIASSFVGHDLTRLVAEILTAQGYLVHVSPPGPDKGIDIVAGRGPLGLEPPRLVVQVKSGNTPADQPTLQALIGSVQDTHADHGLLVCWNGFKSTVDIRKNELFFRIRFWGRAELINSLLQVYDRLPEELNRPWFIWLDYTCGLEERVVKDIRLVIESAPANSVFVTTFNALGAPLGNPKDRPERIRRLLGAVVPDTISRDDCQNARLPETLLKLTSDFMVSVAASFSRPGRFVPAFRIAYSDSTPMITVGGVLPTKRNTVAVESLVAAPSWPAIVKEPIVIPPLTIKEFTALQAQLPRPQRLSRKLVRSLGFDLDADHIRCFGKFYRYYPIYAQITS